MQHSGHGTCRRTRLAFLLAVLGAGLGFLGAACTPAANDGGAQKVVGVSLLTLQHDFYKDLEAGLKAAAAESGIELKIMAAEFDAAQQSQQLSNLAVQNVDAVIVSPCDSAGIGRAIKQLNDKKIPVFTADIAADSGDVICHIASDNVQGGQLAAKTLAELIDGKGEVIVIDHPEVTSVQDRVKGFLDEIGKFPDIVVLDRPSSGGKRDRAFSVTQNKLQAHPNLRGIFAINDDSALGAARAVGAGNVAIVGYDATPEAREAIRSGGPLKADVVQYPEIIGRRTIEAVRDYLDQKSVPGIIPVEVGVVDRKSLLENK